MAGQGKGEGIDHRFSTGANRQKAFRASFSLTATSTSPACMTQYTGEGGPEGRKYSFVNIAISVSSAVAVFQFVAGPSTCLDTDNVYSIRWAGCALGRRLLSILGMRSPGLTTAVRSGVSDTELIRLWHPKLTRGELISSLQERIGIFNLDSKSIIFLIRCARI